MILILYCEQESCVKITKIPFLVFRCVVFNNRGMAGENLLVSKLNDNSLIFKKIVSSFITKSTFFYLK